MCVGGNKQTGEEMGKDHLKPPPLPNSWPLAFHYRSSKVGPSIANPASCPTQVNRLLNKTTTLPPLHLESGFAMKFAFTQAKINQWKHFLKYRIFSYSWNWFLIFSSNWNWFLPDGFVKIFACFESKAKNLTPRYSFCLFLFLIRICFQCESKQ